MPAKEIMKKFKAGTLHSGSPRGPIVKNSAQAKAIQLSYARKEGAHIPNYVSRDELHMDVGTASGVCHASSTVPYKNVAEAGSVPDGSARQRRANNQRRDDRTKLGRGKSAVVEVE
ncbi:MAG: DUF6496 domain-containing protein [Candidatus Acidiferrales bacterium]